MMKTRFLMLAMMMCMTALTFSACSDDDDDDKSIDVPDCNTGFETEISKCYGRGLEAEKLVFCSRLLAGRKRFRYMV